MSSGSDGKHLVNVAAGSYGFTLLGGEYALTVHATWGGGNTVLNALALDGSTEVQVLPAFTADGFASIDLPAGSYQLVITTATGSYISIQKVAT